MFARAMQAHAAPRAVATAARRTGPASFNAPTLPALLRSFSKSSSVAQKLDKSPQLRPNFVARQLQVPIDPTAAREPLGEAIPDTPIAVLRTVTGIRDWASLSCARSYSDDDQGLALVPTMGALHDGHLRLIREAVRRGHNKIVVSIYVNPAQFGVTEDLDSYPKTWDADCAVLRALYEELNAEYTATARPGPNSQPQLEMAVFAPTTPEMYPSGFPGQEVDSNGSFVTITPVGGLLEGKTRPTFFRGVATVCMKLFNIVQPSRVFFGQKDVQQTVVIRKMVRDFCMPLEAVVVPTVRDEGDGLALSSRNVYLGTRRRKVAPVLIRALSAAERAYVSGALDAGEVVPAALKVILDTLDEQKDLPPHEGVLFQLDYISLADPDTMEEIDRIDPSKGAILSGAVKMLPVYAAQEGEDLGHNNGPPVRLIDNIILPPKV